MDCQVANIAAGEKDRIDHIRIGCERQPTLLCRKHGCIVLIALVDPGKDRYDQVIKQLVAEFAATAVAEQNHIRFQIELQ